MIRCDEGFISKEYKLSNYTKKLKNLEIGFGVTGISQASQNNS
jgi:hypothetical protein